MAEKLPTYLRTHRKRGALTQEQLAYLVGYQSRVSIAQLERSSAQPSLETALACQVLFGVPIEELFPGIYRKVVQNIIPRVEAMSEELPDGDTSAAKLKRRLLQAILFRHSARRHKSICRTETIHPSAS